MTWVDPPARREQEPPPEPWEINTFELPEDYSWREGPPPQPPREEAPDAEWDDEFDWEEDGQDSTGPEYEMYRDLFEAMNPECFGDDEDC